ncbi:hypothetical protein CROQUDRAFT_96763 [Cronartium quercuum f. sp. fusiforme G11]|uniref:Uncharacterized protein n=1 Tax=Cronartium quercuum f. sp. fusiforme G11 TaxID=708437 RepID=A0A9P6T8G5_9BASI|nr:hypothetical protein CROQUDRAFT_96763 [Cronartium quercuum f. sp. fusiforme G11]
MQGKYDGSTEAEVGIKNGTGHTVNLPILKQIAVIREQIFNKGHQIVTFSLSSTISQISHLDFTSKPRNSQLQVHHVPSIVFSQLLSVVMMTMLPFLAQALTFREGLNLDWSGWEANGDIRGSIEGYYGSLERGEPEQALSYIDSENGHFQSTGPSNEHQAQDFKAFKALLRSFRGQKLPTEITSVELVNDDPAHVIIQSATSQGGDVVFKHKTTVKVSNKKITYIDAEFQPQT